MKAPPPKSHLHASLPDESFPRGYLLTGIHVGIKKTSPQKPPPEDLAIIVSTAPGTTAAACFTRNAFKAAPVVVSAEVLQRSDGRARGVVVNSGCANAITGAKGLENAWKMVEAADKLIPEKRSGVEETLVMSTGVIGQHVPIDKIVSGIQSLPSGSLGNTFSHWEKAARGFMTTDTFPKLRSRTFTIGGKEYRMAGMDKGAGMIHPDMGPPQQLHATLLGCILTDCAVSPSSLQRALTYAVERSFNSISVDGEMSTNDTILVLANGATPGAVEIDEATDAGAFNTFRDELTAFAIDLAQLVVRDGEGATKFVSVSVEVRTVLVRINMKFLICCQGRCNLR